MKQLFGIALFLLLCCPGAFGHEIRPASMDIVEFEDGSLEFRWRQPTSGEYTIAITPMLSSGWLDAQPDKREVTQSSLIQVWRVANPAEPLTGQRLSIAGLDRTITDVLVRISFADGSTYTHLVKAADPQWLIPLEPAGAAVSDYVLLGLDHIWSGPDHLLYVFALLLLIHNRRSLIMTITAFTLAHSLTLAAAVLGLIQLRPAPVEAVISLSIVYLAVELVRVRQGRPSLASRVPWLIAFVFGLLHGFGFAGALRDIGLPDQAVAMSLLLFNLGIEAGQVLFVLLVIALLWFLHTYFSSLHRGLVRLAPYGIGSLASFWLVERMVVIF